MVKVYVASSWRNEDQPFVVSALRQAGHEVYDFRHPREGDDGFHWSEIDKAWRTWSPEQYREGLSHAASQRGFGAFLDAMKWADVFVGVQPFGRSALLEMGWAAGRGKPTILLLADGEPELMVKLLDGICISTAEVLALLDGITTEAHESS